MTSQRTNRRLLANAAATALFAAAFGACRASREMPLAPTASPNAVTPTSGAAQPIAIEWACVRTPTISGTPLGIPIQPACPARAAAASLGTQHSMSGAAAAAIAAPADLSASVSGTTVMLRWSAPAGPVTSYIIEAGTFYGSSELATFDTLSPATSAIFFNVGPHIYNVRVRARSGADISDPTADVVVVVEGSHCNGDIYGPFGVHVAGQGSSVTLTWDRPILGCPPTDYVIEAGSSPGGIDLANFRTGSTQPRYDAAGVSPGTYYVRVRTVNDPQIGPSFTENILVFGAGCLYSVAPSAVFVSRGGFSFSGLSIETGPTCAWTATADVSWLTPAGGALPTSGIGSRTLSMNLNANISPPRTGTVLVRWPGGGVNVPVTQNGF